MFKSTAIILALSATVVHANEFMEQLESLAESDLASWVASPELLSAIKAQIPQQTP